jgi:hypothetical protein
MLDFVNSRRAWWKLLLAGLLGACFLSGSTQTVLAYADTERDIITQQPVNIPIGERVDEVLVIGNDAIISGTVADAVVVINGNIHLTSTARTGVVIDLGGQVTQDPGAHADGVYTLSFSRPFLNSLTVGSALVIAIWAMRLALSAALVAFPVLFSLIFRSILNVPVSYLETSVRRTGLTGVLVSVVFAAVAGITAITIIGLPVSAILLLLYAIVGLIGFTCVSLWVGRMAKVGGIQEPSIWLQALIGATFVVAFGNLPLMGPFLLMIAWLVGIGAVTMWIWQGWQFRKGRRTT